MEGFGFRIQGCEDLGWRAQGLRVEGPGLCSIVNPRKLEHGFRMINAGIPYTLP